MRAGTLLCGVWACLVGVLVIGGCVATTTSVAVPPPSRWVDQGSGAFATSQGRVFQGIGSASGLQSSLLLRASADNQARGATAGVLNRYIERLAAASGLSSSDTGMMDTLIQAGMSDAIIVDHWQDPQSQTFYSLCRLALTAFKKRLVADNDIDQAQRNALLSHADSVHAAMAAP
jgi:hypothetical protein